MYLCIEQAKHSEADLVSSVLREAAEWLVATGRPMWKPEEISPSSLMTDITGGLYFIARSVDEVCGTVKFQLTDDLFWPDVIQDESAFIHRLAVRRKFAGSGVSEALIRFAAGRAFELGRRFLRLDCASDRAALRRFYRANGLRHHSDFQSGPWHVARFELPLPSQS